jgi:uncharacterized cupin superfamily protein
MIELKGPESKGPVLNVADAEVQTYSLGEHYAGSFRALTPWMQQRGGSLGVNVTRTPPGGVGCPFHYHLLEDEVFYILSGTGVLRYGDDLFPLRPGDCISCPAGTKVAHQIANTGNEDLVYLGIGPNEPNEVCGYPDSGKVMVRGLGKVGFLAESEYMDGEPTRPKILDLVVDQGRRDD